MVGASRLSRDAPFFIADVAGVYQLPTNPINTVKTAVYKVQSDCVSRAENLRICGEKNVVPKAQIRNA
jgi:hypothetical protein